MLFIKSLFVFGSCQSHSSRIWSCFVWQRVVVLPFLFQYCPFFSYSSLVFIVSKNLPVLNFSFCLFWVRLKNTSIAYVESSISKCKPRVNVILGYLHGLATKMGHNVPEFLLFDCNEIKHGGRYALTKLNTNLVLGLSEIISVILQQRPWSHFLIINLCI